jgi:hypothetical protein
MSSSSDYSESCVPESNADSVVRTRIYKSIDLDGKGLVEIFQTLLARSEEHHAICSCWNRSSQKMLAGEEPVTQDIVDSSLLEGLYETRCLKWFLARACKQLAVFIENDVLEQQRRFPRIKAIVYDSDGHVEKFDLEKE